MKMRVTENGIPTDEAFVELAGVSVHIYIGSDGVPVVQIDTSPDEPEGPRGPLIRVYVNDGDAYIGKELTP